MEIKKNIEIIDLALLLKKEKILIITDSHIGHEESLNKEGILVPRIVFKEVIQRLEKIIKKAGKLDKIIINGDVKHEHGNISEQEWRNAIKLINFLEKNCNQLVLIKGNHDKILGPIAEKKNILLADQIIIGDILLAHGHKELNIPKEIKTIIIGHEHPAITISDNARKETFKCFLKGKYKSKDIIVQPSLNLVTYGSDVLTHKRFSPFLKDDLGNFECWVVADKVYHFGKIKNLNI